MPSTGQLDKPALTITPLLTADTRLVIVQPQFLQTVSDHLGDHLTSSDGFDALLNDPLSTIDAESSSVDNLAPVAADVASTPGSFTPDNLDGIAHDLATFNANGDNITSTFGLAAAPPSEPPADTGGFKNTGDDGGGGAQPPSPPGQQGNPDLGGVLPPMDSGL